MNLGSNPVLFLIPRRDSVELTLMVSTQSRPRRFSHDPTTPDTSTLPLWSSDSACYTFDEGAEERSLKTPGTRLAERFICVSHPGSGSPMPRPRAEILQTATHILE